MVGSYVVKFNISGFPLVAMAKASMHLDVQVILIVELGVLHMLRALELPTNRTTP